MPGSRLISRPAIGDKLMKYAASNWTLVNRKLGEDGVGGGRGHKGFDVKCKRPACDGCSTIHVDNIHFEYANVHTMQSTYRRVHSAYRS